MSHTVIAKSDGSVWAFGLNDNGQLGDNSQTNRTWPIQVSGVSDVVAVAAGSYHTLALTSGGVVYAWGDNFYGQLGDGSTTDRKTPVAIALSGVTAIAAGEYHSMALLSSGDVYTWGRNGNGELGINSTTNANTPTVALSGGAAIGAGYNHSLVVKTDGTVWSAGANGDGQLGDNSTTQRTTFVQMSGVSGASKVAGGRAHSLVLLATGTLKAAGANAWGQLGDGSFTRRTTAVAVNTLTNVAGVAANYDHSVAVKSDGSAWSWGQNLSGQLGDGTTTSRNAPSQITALASIAKIATGRNHSIGVSTTGVVSTWGTNDKGQLGDGTASNRLLPAAISGAGYDWKVATPVFSISAGTYTTNQTVVVTVETSGATIHYTQNGNEPTEADPTVVSGGSVTVSTSQTLKAKAFKALMPESSTASAAYTLRVASVTVWPPPGTYTSAQTVTLSVTTPVATIRYTTDGTTPTSSSGTAYSSPLSIATTTTLYAVAFKAGWSDSLVQGGTYTMNFGTLAAPTITPATGTYESSATVDMTAAQSGASIRYTTNGSTPTSTSTLYTGPITVDATLTLKAKAFHPDYTTSAETARTYTIGVAAPTFTPTAGIYEPGQTIIVASATPGAIINYTINGVDPVDSDPTIVSGSTLVVGNYTLKARARKANATTSAVSSANYELATNLVTPALAAGEGHSLVIRADGVPFGWGKNTAGQVGDGTTTSPRPSPVGMAGITGAKAAEGGTDYSLLLKTDGTVIGFGSNGNGRLGDGTTTNRTVPTPIPGLSNVSAIAAGEAHSVALKSDGTVAAWGRNDLGQVGDGTTTQRLTPTAVPTVSNVTAVSAGWGFILARTQSGSIYAWGYNANGRLGDNSTTTRTTAITVPGITTATGVAAGWDHSLAVLSDGTVRAWGRNASGQLGDGSQIERRSPVTVTALSGVVALAGGQAHSLALKSDGTVWAFGSNQYGQLGDGTTTDRWTATQVPGLTNIVSIAAGQLHSAALQSDGTVWLWGRNAQGQLGDGSTTDRLVPTAITVSGMNGRVVTPTISLASGTYSTEQSAAVSVADPSATLHYTTDGAEPTTASATIASGSSITVDRSLVLKVKALKVGSLASLTATATYTLKPATPVIAPTGGPFTETQSVTMTSATTGVTFRYTTDGSDPTDTSTLYSAPIQVSTQTTLKARAFRANWESSAVASRTFTFNYGTLESPTVTPLSASYVSALTVSITAQAEATIRYTLDGAEPTEASLLYSAPFSVGAATVVKAKAFRVDYTPSATRTVPYWVKVATPAVTPASGEWSAGTPITATTTTTGAKVHYTTDGREPTSADPAFGASAPLYVGDFTLKARAFLAGDEASDVVERLYTASASGTIGAVAAGSTHSIALRPDGSLAAWGENGTYRKLGVVYCSSLGIAASNRPILSEATGIKAIDVTRDTTAAVRVDGRVVTWGADDYEHLGHALPSSTCASLEVADRPTPREVSGLSDVVAVDGGLFYFLALKSDGSVWGWGYNADGQLGNDSTTTTGTPVQAIGLTSAITISAGQSHSLAVKSDGTVWAWGSNNWGQLGIACCGNRLQPVQVPNITLPLAIAAGWTTSYAVLANGSVVVWGAIPTGLVPGAGAFSTTPLTIPGLTDMKSIVTNASATYALGADGRLWAWGANQFGQLGDGSTTARNTPGLVPNLPAIRSVSASDYHVLAVAADGSIWSWGRNSAGQVGDRTTGDHRLSASVVMQAGTLDPVTIESPGTFDPSLDRVSYFHTDAIGSVRVITNATGQVLQRYDYKPFGEQWAASGTETNNWRFTGAERDPDTGQDYLGARYYWMSVGRFMRPDDPGYSDPLNPQSMSLYTYGLNNPLRYRDPTGHQADPRFRAEVIEWLVDDSFFDEAWQSFKRWVIRPEIVSKVRAAIPSRCGGGAFGYAGFGTKFGPARFEGLGLVQYDSDEGGSHGGLLGGGFGHYIGGVESMRDWSTWEAHTSPIALAGPEISVAGASKYFGKNINVKTFDVGGLAQYERGTLSVGFYAGATFGSGRGVGGGAYLDLNWNDCRENGTQHE